MTRQRRRHRLRPSMIGRSRLTCRPAELKSGVLVTKSGAGSIGRVEINDATRVERKLVAALRRK